MQIPDVDAVMHTSDFACMKKDASLVDYPRPVEINRVRPPAPWRLRSVCVAICLLLP